MTTRVPERVANTAARLHVLVIPSEEFVPGNDHMAGIFQLHQAKALRDEGFRVGALSIRQALSIPMIARAAILNSIGQKPANALDGKSLFDLTSILSAKLTRPESFISHRNVDGIPVVDIEGFYYLKPTPATNHIGWVRAGMVAFDEYVVRNGKPDVIHAHNLNPAGLLAQRLCKRHGIPFVVTEHSTFYKRGLVPRSLVPALRDAALSSRAVAAVSPSLVEVLHRELAIPHERLKWVPNVIDPFFVSEPARRSRASDTEFVFLCVGRLDAEKGHVYLLRAFAEAFKDVPGAVLRIAGGGPLEAELRDLSQSLGVGQKVKFLGMLSRLETLREIDNSDALVLPSTYETFGVVLIEALVRGRPVIATRCGAPEDFLDERDGMLVQPRDVTGLANALREMKSSAGQYDSRELTQRAIDRFGPDQLVRNLDQMYDAAVKASA